MTITFLVPGRAQPAGSKRGFQNRYTGHVSIVDANKKAPEWKADVRAAAMLVHSGGLLDVPLVVEFHFFVRRPNWHYGTGKNARKLKATAPAYPAQAPDVLKLARGVEDAMTGVIYQDDSLIVQEVLRKDYAETRESFIGVHVTVMTLEALPVNGAQKELIPSGEASLL